MRIHILPWRFILRAMATRAASICFVSRPAAFQGHQPVLAECDRVSAVGQAGAVAAAHCTSLFRASMA